MDLPITMRVRLTSAEKKLEACMTTYGQVALFRAPTFERTQLTFSQMKKFCNSKVSLVTLAGGVGKWLTVCFLLR